MNAGSSSILPCTTLSRPIETEGIESHLFLSVIWRAVPETHLCVLTVTPAALLTCRTCSASSCRQAVKSMWFGSIPESHQFPLKPSLCKSNSEQLDRRLRFGQIVSKHLRRAPTFSAKPSRLLLPNKKENGSLFRIQTSAFSTGQAANISEQKAKTFHLISQSAGKKAKLWPCGML